MTNKEAAVRYGLISGAASTAMMLATIPFIDSGRLEIADVLGYSSIVLSALIVFFGIRSYREKTVDGRLSFRQGFTVGVLMTLVSCLLYAAAFQVMYFKLVPEFGDRFAACMVERRRASGATPQEIAQTMKQAQTFKRLYDRPATNAALTFATSFPIGLVVTAASAAILRKR